LPVAGLATFKRASTHVRAIMRMTTPPMINITPLVCASFYSTASAVSCRARSYCSHLCSCSFVCNTQNMYRREGTGTGV
jgi:hypothetical protein